MKKTEYISEINSYSDKSLHYFAAANTKDGFVSYFNDIFSCGTIKRLYILKGGPGVGKSTIMKYVARKAEENGLTPVYYHCSSDPYSLDGVVVKESGTAVIDGTSPHIFDPVYPGARDLTVNLSDAWDVKKLNENFDKIRDLTLKKSECYNSAYRFLLASYCAKKELEEMGRSALDYNKMGGSVKRFFDKFITKCKKGEVQYVQNEALSSMGYVRFFSDEKNAKKIFFVRDCKLTSKYFFEKLYEHIAASGIEARLGRSAINPDEINHIYFPDSRISISMYDEKFVSQLENSDAEVKTINLARFIDTERFKRVKCKYRFTEKCFETLKNAAFFSLLSAGEYHEKLEKIYGNATDYKKSSGYEK